MHIYTYICSCRIHTDAMNNRTSKDFFKEIYTSHFIVRVRKGLLNVCVREGVRDRTEQQYFYPHSYGRQHCVFLVLQGCSTGGPEAHSAGFLYHILLTTSLDPNSSGGPEGPFGLVWLSVPHLVSLSNCNWSDFLSWLSYIIVLRPLNRVLDLWNGMFNRHQEEITVMQFTGHSLPVHQYMSVPWDFLVPFHQPNTPTRFSLITAIGMCHFLPVHHLGMAGSKVKIQQM